MIDRLSLFTAFEALEQERARGRNTGIVVPIDLSTLEGVPWRWLAAELIRHSALARGLVLEMEATAALLEPEALERIVKLRALGVRIGVHDPGCGLASTQTWSMLPVDVLRLPLSIVEGLPAQGSSEKFLRWKQQGRRLIFDGVQAASSIPLLCELGADYVSGDGVAAIGPKLDFEFG